MRYYLLLKGAGECCDYSPIGGSLACNRRFIKIEAASHDEAVKAATDIVMKIDPEYIHKMFLVAVAEVLTPQLKVAVDAVIKADEGEGDDATEPETAEEQTDEETDEEE